MGEKTVKIPGVYNPQTPSEKWADHCALTNKDPATGRDLTNDQVYKKEIGPVIKKTEKSESKSLLKPTYVNVVKGKLTDGERRAILRRENLRKRQEKIKGS